ncbi:hypothetical protein [Plantactinospora sp. GCM10030261]|uniref:hypothetical protein n=1 Tax=Plantactinospora sp. GCM10030261 TaxID=3273420 RepID=UPI00360B2A56
MGRTTSTTIDQASALRAAARRFYRLARRDQQLAPYFAGTDIDQLAERLTAALVGAWRTGNHPGWAELIADYRRLGLGEDEYDLLGHLLLTTLLPLRLGPDLLIRAGAVLAEARPAVVAQPAGPTGTQWSSPVRPVGRRRTAADGGTGAGRGRTVSRAGGPAPDAAPR